MTGSAALLSGCVAAIWHHDPAGAEALVVNRTNDMGDIPNARNSVADASEKQDIRTVFARNLPDIASTFIPIGAGVQISDRGKWHGEYRAIAHSAGNWVVAHGRRLLKWPKKK